MGRRFESCRAHQELFSVHWIASLPCFEILTHTQPTTLKSPHLHSVHFGRDHLSVLPQHNLRSCVLHVPCRWKPSKWPCSNGASAVRSVAHLRSRFVLPEQLGVNGRSQRCPRT